LASIGISTAKADVDKNSEIANDAKNFLDMILNLIIQTSSII